MARFVVIRVVCASFMACVITSHEATVTVHQSKWRAVMLQCHFLKRNFIETLCCLWERSYHSYCLSFLISAPWCDTYLNTTHRDGKRSDGFPWCVNHCTYYRLSLKPWYDCSLENRHQLDKTSSTRPRATDTKIGGSEWLRKVINAKAESKTAS